MAQMGTAPGRISCPASPCNSDKGASKVRGACFHVAGAILRPKVLQLITANPS